MPTFLEREIELVRPKVIICFGKTAAEYILNLPGGGLGRLRGQVYKKKDAAVGVTYHPAYLLYNKNKEAAIKWSMWNDIAAALDAAEVTYKHQTRKKSGT